MLESDFFEKSRPVFHRLEAYGFRNNNGTYEYSEDLPDGQFRAEFSVTTNGEIKGRVIDLETGDEYLPLRLENQIGGFIGHVREMYLEFLGRIRQACFITEGKGPKVSETGAWMIPSNPKIYDVDAGFRGGRGEIEWHQHNNIKPGDEVYIYSSAPNSALLYRCEVVASDLSYHGMFKESKGYERSMRIRLIEKYPKDKYPLSFIKAHGGSVVRSARSMPQELYEAIKKSR